MEGDYPMTALKKIALKIHKAMSLRELRHYLREYELLYESLHPEK